MNYLQYFNSSNGATPFALPPTGTLYAAYRPIVIEVIDNAPFFGFYVSNMPVVYLDVYINGTYYKTLSSTSPIQYHFVGTIYRPYWRFDLQDVFQEYLRSEPATLAGGSMPAAPEAICTFYTKARGSSVNSAGFTVPDGPVPVQGNFDSPPVAGGGIQSLTYVVANSTIQHQEIFDLLTHLTAYKYQGVASSQINILPLTHRPTNGNYRCGLSQNDHFPVLLPWNAFPGTGNTTTLQPELIMDWMEQGSSTVFFRTTGAYPVFATVTAPAIVNIPVGLANLNAVSWVIGSATPDMQKLTKYRVYLKLNSNVVWQSGWITVDRCAPADTRLHFLNALGGFDAVNFIERQELLVTQSNSYQKSLPLTGMARRDYGHQRFNVTSNEKVTLRTNVYDETCQQWLKELLDSPRVYLETLSQGDASPSLVPVVIVDGEFITRKVDNRHEYMLEVTYQPSNERIRQRG